MGGSRAQQATSCHILAAGFAAERQFAAVAKLHAPLRPVVAHALDIAEEPFQSSGPVESAAAGSLHGALGRAEDGPSNQSAIHENAVQRLAARLERERKCGAEWKEAKAAGKIEKGMTWPKYWSACNKRLKAKGA